MRGHGQWIKEMEEEAAQLAVFSSPSAYRYCLYPPNARDAGIKILQDQNSTKRGYIETREGGRQRGGGGGVWMETQMLQH